MTSRIEVSYKEDAKDVPAQKLKKKIRIKEVIPNVRTTMLSRVSSLFFIMNLNRIKGLN